MRVLVDTHALLWDLLGDPRSSRKAIRILGDAKSELIFSHVSLWETAVNIQLGRLPQLGSSVSYLRDRVLDYGMELLPVRFEHILALESLPMHHRDPFDRMLIAQAKAESLTILTKDESFRKYEVTTIW